MGLEITFLQGLWFLLIAVLIAGYFVLDGFDLGIGVLYPFIGKTDHDKALMRRAVGPIWDGNEVWLLTAGGALFAAFAPAYATSFSGFYLAIMLVLFGLIGRAVSLEFRAHDHSLTGVWDIVFFVGSLLPALLLGVAVGNIINGIELDAAGTYIGGFFALLNPFSLVCGLLGMFTMIFMGASWLIVKTHNEEAVHARAMKVRPIAAALMFILFAVATALYAPRIPEAISTGGLDSVLVIVFAILFVIALILALVLMKAGKELLAFLIGTLCCIALVGLAFSTLFPYMIIAIDPALSISIAGAASSETALTAMTIVTCIGLPLVLIYHIIIYRTFRGKITADDLSEY